MYCIRNRFGFYFKSFDGSYVEWTSYICDSKSFTSRHAAHKFLDKMDAGYLYRQGIRVVSF